MFGIWVQCSVASGAGTGQRRDATGLHFYNARYYDSLIGRFVSADTIVAEPGGSQGYNRFAYVKNNPLRWTDPSGHCFFGLDTLVCVAIAIAGGVIAGTTVHITVTGPISEQWGQPLIANDTNAMPCSASLTSCYQQGTLSTLKDGQVSEDEFFKLLETVATDVKEGMTPRGLPAGALTGRGRFDTPFYNGGGNGSIDLFPSDQQVCIGNQGCGGRSEINYFAQGFWSADSGESLETALWTTSLWNKREYDLSESKIPGKLFWTKYGYAWYKNWLERGDDWQDYWEPPKPDDGGGTPQ